MLLTKKVLSPFPIFVYLCTKILIMKRILILSFLFAALSVQAERSVLFNFHEPSTLSPSVATPGTKEGISLDGRFFEADGVHVAFEACDEGNTHVRLYGSYDAGVDLRIYDGDCMTISTVAPDECLLSATVTVSFSGGQADADFVAWPGEWVWVDNTWLAGSDAPVREVTMMSVLQSRLYTLTVTVGDIKSESGIAAIGAPKAADEQWYSLSGQLIGEPDMPGVYLCRRGSQVLKVIR